MLGMIPTSSLCCCNHSAKRTSSGIIPLKQLRSSYSSLAHPTEPAPRTVRHRKAFPDLWLCWGSQLMLQLQGKGCRHVMYEFPIIRAWLEGMG